MEYGKRTRTIPACLECGDRIRYGRTDKKFCCEECKNRHYNRLARCGRAYRRKVTISLMHNYKLLEEILRRGDTAADLSEMILLGFDPDVITGHHRLSNRFDEYFCYDIKYRMTGIKLCSISKIQNVSLHLQDSQE